MRTMTVIPVPLENSTKSDKEKMPNKYCIKLMNEIGKIKEEKSEG